MFRIIRSFAAMAACCAIGAHASEVTVESIMEAYSDMNYPLARKLAGEMPERPEARLVLALCDVYDRAKPNITRGQQELNLLFREKNLSPRLRAEAGISLARTAQLMKERRDIYGNDADLYDHIAIFREVAQIRPGSNSERDAFLYRIREELENETSRDAAFLELETFPENFKGDARLLVPVRLLAEYEYIKLRGDYKSAIRHLKAASETGFENPSEERSAAFRIAFLTDKKLKDREQAISYYQDFMKKYPFASQTVVAKRYLKALGVEVPDVEEK